MLSKQKYYSIREDAVGTGVVTGRSVHKKLPKRNSWIAGTAAYQPGPRQVAGPEADLPPLFLDANESRTSSIVLTRLAEELTKNPALLCTYPSTAGLEQSLAERYGVASERVVVCTGADDAIQRVISYCCSTDDKVLAYEPAFAMYEVYTRIRGGLPLTLPWFENDAFPQAATLELLRNCPSLALVCLASPANPVGNCISRSELEVLAEACAINGKSLLLDTTYEEFAGERPGRAMAQSGLCYAVGTFSKAWGLAGLRIGWVIAPDAGSARCLRAAGGPYPASGLALAAAGFALQDDEGLNQLRTDIGRRRPLLIQALSRLGLSTVQSEGNFIFARSGGSAVAGLTATATGTSGNSDTLGAPVSQFADTLAAAGIFIRSWPDTPGLQNALRISVPASETDFERLLDVLKNMEAVNDE